MDVQKYNQVASQALVLLSDARADAKIRVPRKVISKTGFGDVDIVLALPGSNSVSRTMDLVKHNLAHLDDTDFSRNGNNLEFEIFEETVDLIVCTDKGFESAAFYYDNGYLGMLLGALASYHGLKLGFDGLHYRHETKGKMHDVPVTRDPRHMMHVMGLDYHYDFLPGFGTPEDVFEVVQKSSLFSKAAFESENRSHRQRDRDKRRDQWDEFRSFLESADDTGLESPIDPMDHLQSSLPAALMSDVERKIHNINDLQQLYADARQVFNGNHVMDELGVEGAALGVVMGKLRAPFDNKEEYARHIMDRGTQGMLDEAREAALS